MPDQDIRWRAARAAGDTLRIWDMQGAEVVALHNVPLPDGTDPAHVLYMDDDDTRVSVLCGGIDAVRPLPCAPLETSKTDEGVVRILPLRQESPTVLTDGEEAAIGGYLAAHPRFDGIVLCLTEQSLWAHISADEVVSMMAFDTPRLAAAFAAEYRQGAAFDAALADTLSRPERIAAHLAQARTGRSGQEIAHLIGAEIADARPYWLGQFVVILADEGAEAPYAAALKSQGTMVETASFSAAFLTGCGLAIDT
jgi:2-dehydro-3-deoxygalactonokinase